MQATAQVMLAAMVDPAAVAELAALVGRSPEMVDQVAPAELAEQAALVALVMWIPLAALVEPVELVAPAASAASVVLAATPQTVSTETVVLAVLVVEQVPVVQAATEVRLRPPLLVALAEPAELLEHRVAAEVVAPQEQAELVVQPE
jgi:hypothetical protein